jgi:serine/threonine-protein phosphatase 2A regulatory subunit A
MWHAIWFLRANKQCQCLLLLQEFGPDWAREHLVPPVLAMINNPHYLYRMTVLVAVASLAQYVTRDTLCNTMLPVVVGCSRDRVPNVKFNVAKMLERIAPLVDSNVISSTVKPCLTELAEDADADVRFYARQALQACDNIAMT